MMCVVITPWDLIFFFAKIKKIYAFALNNERENLNE